ncbi:hypothetical protein [Streptomyces sp. NPDC020747]|uniref:hypothetical protein n=1 Tax=Streptomyces sp. NPDC020747 TaxID=3365086 RepID=UPI00379D78D8
MRTPVVFLRTAAACDADGARTALVNAFSAVSDWPLGLCLLAIVSGELRRLDWFGAAVEREVPKDARCT